MRHFSKIFEKAPQSRQLSITCLISILTFISCVNNKAVNDATKSTSVADLDSALNSVQSAPAQPVSAPVQQPSVQTQTPSVEQPQVSASIPSTPAQDVQRVTLSQAMEQNRAQQNVNPVNIQAPQGIADATTVIPIVNPDNGATTPNTNVGIAEQIQQNNINNIQG